MPPWSIPWKWCRREAQVSPDFFITNIGGNQLFPQETASRSPLSSITARRLAVSFSFLAPWGTVHRGVQLRPLNFLFLGRGGGPASAQRLLVSGSPLVHIRHRLCNGSSKGFLRFQQKSLRAISSDASLAIAPGRVFERCLLINEHSVRAGPPSLCFFSSSLYGFNRSRAGCNHYCKRHSGQWKPVWNCFHFYGMERSRVGEKVNILVSYQVMF